MNLWYLCHSYSRPDSLRAALTPLATLLLMVIGLIASLSSSHQAEAQGQQPTSRHLVDGCWTPFTSLSAGVTEAEISQLTLLSANDAWAVGYSKSPSSRPQALALHWDGKQWAVTRITTTDYLTTTLTAVAGVSTNNVWAIGSYSTRLETGVLALHWDGTRWDRVPAPELPAKARFFSMAAISSTDVWAVGADYTAYSDSGGEKALIAHWNGKEWSLIPIPEVGGILSVLRGMQAISATDVWAVGIGTGTGTLVHTFQPLIMHWNGIEWSIAPAPELLEGGQLYGVTALSADNIWAVGQRSSTLEGAKAEALVMRWNGSEWNAVFGPSVSGSTNINLLYSVSARSAEDIWAVGEGSRGQMGVIHWDGQRWSGVELPLPTPPPTSVRVVSLRLVAASPTGDLWLTGQAVTVVSGTSGPNATTGLLLRRSAEPCSGGTGTVESPVPTVPGSGSQLFSETGKTVSGVFLEYWTRNGGLVRQGFPISNLMLEVNELDGKAYAVRYFERAVFEYHPGNRPPYDVLLSHLGAFRYRAKFPTGAPGQQSQEGGVYIPETGKRLSGVFLEYWQHNGGLLQYGFPISDPFHERSDLNGQTYLVQYFERAVFEYHPGNRPPYDVLLSQFGTFRYR